MPHVKLHRCLLSAIIAGLLLGDAFIKADETAKSRGEAMQLLRRARVAMQTGDAPSGQKLVKAALAFAAQSDDPLVEGWSQQLAGELAFGSGDHEAAIGAFSAALTAFTKAKDASGAAASRLNLGRLQLAANKPKEARTHFQAALGTLEKLNRQAETAQALNDLADAERATGNTDAAREALSKALAICDRDTTIEPSTRLETLLGLGTCFLTDEKPEAAEKPLTEAVALAKQVDNPVAEADAHAALGMVLQRAGKVEAAQNEYKAALQSYLSTKNALREADVRNNLGALAQEQGLLPQAKGELTKALQLYTQAKSDAGAARALCNLALAQESEGKLADAAASYEKALALRQKLKDAAGTAKIFDSLASLAASSGDTAKAKQLREDAERLRQN
jgi:tetratricopeptide (TPR) repeat protein